MKKDPYHHIFVRDNWTCQYCGFDASEEFESFWIANLNIDHIKPKSKGGSNDDENLAVACRACNLYKGSIDCNSIEDAKKIVQEKQEQSKRWFNHFVLNESDQA